jgi:fructuronate reductase
VTRLSAATLPGLPGDIGRPGYDRAAVRTGIVHLGIGAFHRAHQATLFDAALAAGDGRWGVCGVSLRSAEVRDQLAPQDGLYSLVERDAAGERVRVVGAVRQVLVAPEDPGAVVAALASPDVHLVTLTVTEKGYRLAGGTLDVADPGIVHDLATPGAPKTAVGFLVAGLARRRAAGLPPFTVLSCDNLPRNGHLLRDAVLAFADRLAPALARWIAAEGAFPQSMVDRIVPATTATDVAALAARLGCEDRAMVKTEPFLQWVIEDRFCGPRPDFAALGAQLTADIAPWEEAKLRLLNGAHSAIAYLGGLAGIEHVHAFVARAQGRRFVERLWAESATTLSPPAGLDLVRYRGALMARFANPALMHRTRQIAMDGSQKLPQRLLAPIARRLERGQDIGALALAVAAWMRWQDGRDDAGSPHAVEDPLAAITTEAVRRGRTAGEKVANLLEIGAIFEPRLAANAPFRASLTARLATLEEMGADAAVAHFCERDALPAESRY